MGKQTSVELLFNKLWETPKDKFTWCFILNEAKEMHKQEILDAFEMGEKEEYQNRYEIVDGERHYCYDNSNQYYNETFNHIAE